MKKIGLSLLAMCLLVTAPIMSSQAGDTYQIKSHGTLECTDENGQDVLLTAQDLHVLQEQIDTLPDAFYQKGYEDAQSNIKAEYVYFGIGTKTLSFADVKHGYIVFGSQCQVGGGPGFKTSSNMQLTYLPGVRKQCVHDNALAMATYCSFDVTDDNPIWIQFYNTKYPEDTFSCVRALVVCDK